MGSASSCPSFPFKEMSSWTPREEIHTLFWGTDPSCPKVSKNSELPPAGPIGSPSPYLCISQMRDLPSQGSPFPVCQPARPGRWFLLPGNCLTAHSHPLASPAPIRCSINVPSFALSSLLLGAALQPAQPLRSQDSQPIIQHVRLLQCPCTVLFSQGPLFT